MAVNSNFLSVMSDHLLTRINNAKLYIKTLGGRICVCLKVNIKIIGVQSIKKLVIWHIQNNIVLFPARSWIIIALADYHLKFASLVKSRIGVHIFPQFCTFDFKLRIFCVDFRQK